MAMVNHKPIPFMNTFSVVPAHPTDPTLPLVYLVPLLKSYPKLAFQHYSPLLLWVVAF
jgi:hypothetical protein